MTAPAKTPKPQPLVEIGATGLRIWDGRVNEEFDPKLRDPRTRYKLYQEMADNDPTVGAGLRAMTLLARQVEWRFEHEHDDDPRVEFLNTAKDELAHPWGDLIAEALWNMFVYGWAYHEIVYAKLSTGEIGWSKFAPRGADSLERWIYDTATERVLLGMEQRPAPKFQLIQIPLAKALLFRTESLKDNPEGRSILRNCYRPWYFKKRIENIEGIGVERDLAGLPVMHAPARLFTSAATTDETQVLDYLKEIVVNIRRDEQEGVVLPSAYDEQGNELYKLELLSTGGDRQFNTNEVIQRYDLRILQTMMADFLQVGHEKVGSFALASSKTNLFAVSLGTYLDQIAGQFNRKAIPDLLELNGFATDDAPKLVHGDIEAQDMAEFGAFLGSLASAGFPLFPDMSLENKLRGMIGLEPLSQGEWEERQAEREAAKQEELQQQMDMAQAGKPEPAPTEKPAAKPEPAEKRAPESPHFHVHMDSPKAPDVRVDVQPPSVRVEQAKASDVHVTVEAPPAPQVTIEAPKAPDVHVQVDGSPVTVQAAAPVVIPAPVVSVEAAKAPDVHVDVAAPSVTVQPPSVQVAAPQITVEAPHVTVPVTVEKQDAPVVDMQPVAEAITAAAETLKRPSEVRIVRGSDGKAESLRPEP
jgi:hypothetical protein